MENNYTAILSVTALILSIIVFYLHALIVSKKPFTLKGFTIADQTVNKNRFANTFTAGSFSLSTVFAFFLAYAGNFGLILLIAGLTYFLGAYLLAYITENKEIDLGENYTQAALIYDIFQQKLLARTVAIITALSFLFTVFLELYFGAILLNLFMPFEGEFARFLSYTLLALVVLGYLRMGGFRVVVVTDGWQMLLMSVAVLSLLTLAIFIPTNNNYALTTEVTNWFGNAGTTEIVIFVLWISLLNIVSPFGRLSLWQRLAAIKGDETPINVTKAAWKKFFFIWWIPIVAIVLMYVKGYSFDTLNSFLQFTSQQTGWLGIVLFPLIYMGLASMLLSTVDTRLIAVLTSLSDRSTFYQSLDNIENKSEDKLRLVATVVVGVLFLVLGFFYMYTVVDYFDLLKNLINVIFNGLGILAPFVVYSAFLNNNTNIRKFAKNASDKPLFIILILSYSSIIISAYYGFLYNQTFIGQISLVLVLVLETLAIYVYHKTYLLKLKNS